MLFNEEGVKLKYNNLKERYRKYNNLKERYNNLKETYRKYNNLKKDITT